MKQNRHCLHRRGNGFSAINPVAAAVWRACITELEALKPGNVSVYADGHAMRVDDFIDSAGCIANILASPGLGVGEAILQSIAATRAAVGCNTNLGIVLLCAPLAHCALRAGSGPLPQRLAKRLPQLDSRDTQLVFDAIRLAQPAGLGSSERYDVNRPVSVGLLEAMRAAEHYDRIAYQYTHDFIDVFATGLPVLDGALQRGLSEPWAAVEVYLNFLARFQDTHIRRKLGAVTAKKIQREGSYWLERLTGSGTSPEQMTPQLLGFDHSLKQRGINPGTSADLTVATLLAHHLLLLERSDFEVLVSLLPGSRLFSPRAS